MGKIYEKDGKIYEENWAGCDREVGQLKDDVGGNKYDYSRSSGGHNIEIKGNLPHQWSSKGTVDDKPGTFVTDVFAPTGYSQERHYFQTDKDAKGGSNGDSEYYRVGKELWKEGKVGYSSGRSWPAESMPKERTPIQKITSFFKGAVLISAVLAGSGMLVNYTQKTNMEKPVSQEYIEYSEYAQEMADKDKDLVERYKKENNVTGKVGFLDSLLIPAIQESREQKRGLMERIKNSRKTVYGVIDPIVQSVGKYNEITDLESIIKNYERVYDSRVGMCLSHEYLVDTNGNIFLLSCDSDIALFRDGVKEGYLDFEVKDGGNEVQMMINRDNGDDGIYFRKANKSGHLQTNNGDVFYNLESRNEKEMKLIEITSRGDINWTASGVYCWMDDMHRLYLMDPGIENKLIKENKTEAYLKPVNNADKAFELYDGNVENNKELIHLVRYKHGKRSN